MFSKTFLINVYFFPLKNLFNVNSIFSAKQTFPLTTRKNILITHYKKKYFNVLFSGGQYNPNTTIKL